MSSDQLFLITGATGNTGAPTVEFLLRAGRRVRACMHGVDRRCRGARRSGRGDRRR